MKHETRFDLEQQIMDVWGTKEDLDLLFESVVEDKITSEQTANILMGMAELFQLKCDRMFNTFEKLMIEMK